MPATSGTCTACRESSCTLKPGASGALECRRCRGEAIHKPASSTLRGFYGSPRPAERRPCSRVSCVYTGPAGGRCLCGAPVQP